ncbi:MAG: SWF/SNF helicase family protein, partial [Prevotella sp.]|nr:SWF/SNF helicase family protein [Prevotella sp.]
FSFSCFRLSQSVRKSLDTFNASGKFIVLRLLLEKILLIGEFADVQAITLSSSVSTSTTSNKRPKVVIFSQHPAILDLIVSQILCHYEGLHYVLLSSSQSPQQRMQGIDNFQQQDHIRLLLTTTGVAGHGFTLTAANTIILVDHNYNPFTDMQAIDRCHRIGA